MKTNLIKELKGEQIKMTIKEFCDKYTTTANNLRKQYIKDNLKIADYIPIARKIALADLVVNHSIYKYDEITKDNNTVEVTKTDKIEVNSVVNYILFCRVIIENYTNLNSESNTFFEEYDALKQSGLLDELLLGTETRQSLIPASEIAEMKTLIAMKKDDTIFNASEIHNYISAQIDRFSDLASFILKPIVDKVSERFNNMSEEDVKNVIDNVVKFLGK